MKKVIILSFVLGSFYAVNAQVGIHQEESELHAQDGISDSAYEALNHPAAVQPMLRTGCNLNKVVYGWHPYWNNGLQVNYQWNLLSHFCYFSYEVDANTGNAITSHSFSTTQSVTDALNNGVKVNLCVTLFSNHATFLGNATSRQTLITNLINMIQARGAHGVNIDFEGIPSSQSANFTAFMNDLAAQFHAAIPGSEVSTVLYAVDWNSVFNVSAMTNVDMFVIMGYDYYWSGSSTSGPNDPLYQFGTSYNYTLSKSVSYYLAQGVPKQKLILGLPYYGREWDVTAQAVPSSTTASGVARTFTYVKNNATGYYSAANRNRDLASMSTYYAFNNGNWNHCFITEKQDMHERLDFIVKRDIGGMGIWALGYDDGFNDFWNEIDEHLSVCPYAPCTDSLFDIGGGPLKDYYNNEDYTFTLSPAGATAVQVSFSSFSVENNYDYLYIYDGPSTASPQISGSPFTGTSSPGNFTSSGPSLTFRFTSDGATTGAGWNATYSCIADAIAPTTQVAVTGTWQTQNFNAAFTDADNAGGTGVNESFWQVLDFDGTEWRGNYQHGFFNDNFTSALHAEWTQQTGPWNITAAHLNMSDQVEQNSNIYASVTQQPGYTYLYHWQMNLGGTGTNRRAGMHFFCDDPTLPNRGNSYFVYYRADSDKCQIYKVVNDVYTLVTDDIITVDPGIWYDCKVTYNPVTGRINAYLDNVLAGSWIDNSPLQSGTDISLRSGGTDVLYDDVKVYRLRGSNEIVSIGSSADMVRFQNSGPAQPACRIKTLINDMALNWSSAASQDVNIDWTAPAAVLNVNDGFSADIDTSYDQTTFMANFNIAADPHSAIQRYEYALGLSAGDSSVVGWTQNGLSTSITHTGLALALNTTYFVSVRAVNGASLTGVSYSSDGFIVVPAVQPPVSAFNIPVTDVCLGDSVLLQNNSQYAAQFKWSADNGAWFNNDTLPQPYISFPSGGTYTLQLVASSSAGSDTSITVMNINVFNPPQSFFTTSDTLVYLPNAFVGFSNNSLDATTFYWDFGNGQQSADVSPWIIYTTPGQYVVYLVASNGICPSDTSVVTITVDAGTGGNEADPLVVKIFPVPAHDMLFVQWNGQSADLRILNSAGQVIMSEITLSNPVALEVSRWPAGIYILHLKTERGQSLTRKVIVH